MHKRILINGYIEFGNIFELIYPMLKGVCVPHRERVKNTHTHQRKKEPLFSNTNNNNLTHNNRQ